MKLISWNTNGRIKQAKKQIETILGRKPDVVALQEVRRSSIQTLKKELASRGFSHIRTTVGMAAGRRKGPRATGVLITSQFSLRSTDFGLSVPWREKALSVIVSAPEGQIEIHTVHVPPGSQNGWIKVKILRSVYSRLARCTRRRRILCGDFNAPQLELASGEVVTWAQRYARGHWILKRRFRGGSGQRWHDAERNIFLGLRRFEMVDVYREIHGYKAKGFSWVLRRGTKRTRRRFDHVCLLGI